LIDQRPLVVRYDSDTPWRSIVDGVAIVHCFGGDVARAINNGVTQVRYIRPREGFTPAEVVRAHMKDVALPDGGPEAEDGGPEAEDGGPEAEDDATPGS